MVQVFSDTKENKLYDNIENKNNKVKFGIMIKNYNKIKMKYKMNVVLNNSLAG